MKIELNIFDDLIRKIFKMTPKQFDLEMIEKYQKEINDLTIEYGTTDPWHFVKRAMILRRIGFCTLKVKYYQADLDKRIDEELDNQE